MCILTSQVGEKMRTCDETHRDLQSAPTLGTLGYETLVRN